MTAASSRPGVPRAPLYPTLLAAATVTGIEPMVRARYLSVAHWLDDFWSWRAEDRRRWQAARLREVMEHATANVPYYQRLASTRGGQPLDLRDLPVVDKAEMRADMDTFRCKNWDDIPHVTKETGGSTGEVWEFPIDKAAWAHVYGAVLHLRKGIGFRYGERLVLLGQPPSLMPHGSSWKNRLRRRIENQVVASVGLRVDPASSLDRVRRAGELHGVLWYGYAWTVAAMAEAALANGLVIPGPRAIVTTAEPLYPAWRERIEEAFGAPVYDEYGCNDGGVMAQTCRAGRFHLAENISTVEVLENDEPCPPGVEGDVVVTNLHNRTLPFLRYRNGDRAVLGDGPCPCGRPGATISRIVGRRNDRIALPDGHVLTSLPLGDLFHWLPSVRRWQLVELGPGELKVRLEVHADFTADDLERVRDRVQGECGDATTVTLTTEEPIEITSGGKHRVVVRETSRGGSDLVGGVHS